MSSLSLKGLIGHVSDLTGMSEAAVYERQRALVRLGCLKSSAGEGQAAVFEERQKVVGAFGGISLLATGNLSDVGLSTRTFANLEIRKAPAP